MMKLFYMLLVAVFLCPQPYAAYRSCFNEAGDEELMLLARFIEAETDGRDWLSMIETGSMVLKRVRSPLYADTIAGVIFEEGAFACVTTGSIYCEPSYLAKRAAADCINGMLS